MTSSNRLVDLPLATFSERVRDAGGPAGGAVAATAGALGAGLASMAFRAAAGDPGPPGGAPDSDGRLYDGGRADALHDLSERLLALVDRDAEAYAAWRAAPDDAAAVEAVLEAPLEIAEGCLACLRILASGADRLEAPVLADGRAAAHQLLAGLGGAAEIARVNLALLPRDEHRDDLGATIQALLSEGRRLAQPLVMPPDSAGATPSTGTPAAP